MERVAEWEGRGSQYEGKEVIRRRAVESTYWCLMNQ